VTTSSERFTPSQQQPKCFREPEVWLLLVLVIVAYWIRLGDVSLRGEEPRWAQEALGMLQSGDWIVPRGQGEPDLTRAPLHSWLVALSSAACRTRAAWAVRLPSVLALLLTVLLIYGYCRTFLSRTGALAAALAFLTMGEMFTTGCQAHTEMVFISLVSASLLLWHWGEVRGWPETATWIICYILVGLGVLTKGPQPPVYFVSSVGAYLLWTGQWRRLFRWPHLTGCLVAVTLVGCWVLLFARQEGWSAAYTIIMVSSAGRMSGWRLPEVARHMGEFPLEVLGCTLPWSLLLLGYASGPFRRSLGRAQPHLVYQGICVGIAFLSCWIPPGGQTRYFSPLYPCLGVLIGAVVDRCATARVPALLTWCWRWYAHVLGFVMLAAGVVVSGAALVLPSAPKYQPWVEPPLVALGYGTAMLILAALCWWARRAGNATRVRTVVLTVTCFMVLTLTGIVTDIRVRRSADQAGAVALLKQRLPSRQRLVSLGHVDDLFAYYYELPIAIVPPADLTVQADAYFCIDSYCGARPPLPFAWEEIAIIPMDRNRRDQPERAVVVGHCPVRQPQGALAYHPAQAAP
jgi:4-amino-4-deoxy-L-arabinose transferase-like glycosyltransferase